MKKKNVLFVCNAGLNRSATGALLVEEDKNANKKYNAKHAGTHWLAFMRINKYAVQWADIIIFMEPHNKEIVLHRFPSESKGKETHVLNIPDNYVKGEAELVRILKEKLSRILKIKWRD